MPNTSGAVLDWVPQKAAQQTHSATPRRLNANAYASPLGAAQRARRSDYGSTSSIHLRNAVKLLRSAQMSAAHARVRHMMRVVPSGRHGRRRIHHSAAVNCSAGSSQLCERADLVPQHTYQEPNRNSSGMLAELEAAKRNQGQQEGAA